MIGEGLRVNGLSRHGHKTHQELEQSGCVTKGLCVNCLGDDQLCPDDSCVKSPCRACGQSHSIWECSKMPIMCMCRPRPEHIANECNVICRMCWIERGRPDDSNINDMPQAYWCNRHCAPCGMARTDRRLVDVYCHRRRCADCQHTKEDDLGAFHFTQDCPKHVCVAEECLTTRGNPCKKHCMGCGFAHTGFPTMDSWHTCQWTKERRFVSLGFKIQGSGTRKYEKELFISRDILVCKRNPSHKTTTARELKGVREKGSRRLLEDMLWWLPLGIDTMNPREMCPIVECEECFAELYDGGDYRTQVPGALRHHLPLQPTPPAQSL